jgi:hypothetical protein
VVEGVEVVLVVGLGLGILVFLMKWERLPGAVFFFKMWVFFYTLFFIFF